MVICDNPNLQLKKEALWVVMNAILTSDAITKQKILRLNDYKLIDVFITISLQIPRF